MLNLEPKALVLRLFLYPDDVAKVGILFKLGGKRFMREGIDLLNTNNGNVIALTLTTLVHKVVVNLSGADHDPLDFLGLNGRVNFANNRLELPERQLLQGGAGILVAK